MNFSTRHRTRTLYLGALLPLSLTQTLEAQEIKPTNAVTTTTTKPWAETTAQRDKRMEWFREARFGLFIHWGVYAVPAGEHNGKTNYGEWFLEQTKMPVSQYEKFAPELNPVKFDADQWVQLAKDAGMKYIVITSKHHDGFAMYPSQLSNWNIKRTPFQRDPLLELAAACKKAGIKLCFYHSIMDWHHPDYLPRRAYNDVAQGTPEFDRYVAYMKGQLSELLTKYGPIGILWFDGEWENTWNNERGVDLYNYVRALQPNIIINNRVGKGRAGMQGMNKGEGVGDYGTPEQEIPATGFGPSVDWESCMTMNGHWGFNKSDQKWKSAETLVRNLIDCASKGGNYLLNVGPTAQGEIPAPSIERLQQIGAWMKVNREAIYDTSASPFKQSPWGRATKRTQGNTTSLYLHVCNWPADGILRVPGLTNRIETAAVLGAPGRKLVAMRDENGLALRVGPKAPDAISTTIVLRFQGAPVVQDVLITQKTDGALQLTPVEAIAHGTLQVQQAADKRDNFGFWLKDSDWIEWNFEAVRPGRYEISAEIANEAASAFDILLGNQKVRANLTPTGNYKKFQNRILGTVEIAATGTYNLQIKPASDWQPVNLRELSLKPLS